MLIADCRCPTCGGELPDADLVVDLDNNTACRFGLVVQLSPQPAEVLFMLAKASPRVLKRDTLMRGVWGINEPPSASRAVDVNISRLRREIEPLGLTIITVRSEGYALRKVELFEAENVRTSPRRELVAA